jgi:hypothetical protein
VVSQNLPYCIIILKHIVVWKGSILGISILFKYKRSLGELQAFNSQPFYEAPLVIIVPSFWKLFQQVPMESSIAIASYAPPIMVNRPYSSVIDAPGHYRSRSTNPGRI